jgi:hypothetical protein
MAFICTVKGGVVRSSVQFSSSIWLGYTLLSPTTAPFQSCSECCSLQNNTNRPASKVACQANTRAAERVRKHTACVISLVNIPYFVNVFVIFHTEMGSACSSTQWAPYFGCSVQETGGRNLCTQTGCPGLPQSFQADAGAAPCIRPWPLQFTLRSYFPFSISVIFVLLVSASIRRLSF